MPQINHVNFNSFELNKKKLFFLLFVFPFIYEKFWLFLAIHMRVKCTYKHEHIKHKCFSPLICKFAFSLPGSKTFNFFFWQCTYQFKRKCFRLTCFHRLFMLVHYRCRDCAISFYFFLGLVIACFLNNRVSIEFLIWDVLCRLAFNVVGRDNKSSLIRFFLLISFRKFLVLSKKVIRMFYNSGISLVTL